MPRAPGLGVNLGTKPEFLFERIFDRLPFTPPLVALSVPLLVKAVGCSSLRGEGGELGSIKTLTYGSN